MIDRKGFVSFATGKGSDLLFPPGATRIHVSDLYSMPVQGLCNRMYVFSTIYSLKNCLYRKDFVLRTSRGPNVEHRMTKEYRAMKILEANGLPVPAVIALELDRNTIGTPFIIMEKINGASISSFLNNNEKALPMIDILARLMASLHKIDYTVLFSNDFSGNPQTQAIGFCENVLSELKDCINVGYITSLSPFVRRKYLKALMKLKENKIHNSSLVLIHSDFGPDHVLLSDSGPVIIDWEGVRLGDPAYDVSWMYHILKFEGQIMIDHRFVNVPKLLSSDFNIGEEFVNCYRKHYGSTPANLEAYKDIVALKLAANLDLHVRPGYSSLSRILRLKPMEIFSQTVYAYTAIECFKRNCELFLRERNIL